MPSEVSTRSFGWLHIFYQKRRECGFFTTPHAIHNLTSIRNVLHIVDLFFGQSNFVNLHSSNSSLKMEIEDTAHPHVTSFSGKFHVGFEGFPIVLCSIYPQTCITSDVIIGRTNIVPLVYFQFGAQVVPSVSETSNQLIIVYIHTNKFASIIAVEKQRTFCVTCEIHPTQHCNGLLRVQTSIVGKFNVTFIVSVELVRAVGYPIGSIC